jgi:acetyl-CoA synthase
MPKALKEELGEMLAKTAEELGLEDFLTKIADETVAQTEEEVVAYMQKVNHPALTLAPMF